MGVVKACNDLMRSRLLHSTLLWFKSFRSEKVLGQKKTAKSYEFLSISRGDWRCRMRKVVKLACFRGLSVQLSMCSSATSKAE